MKDVNSARDAPAESGSGPDRTEEMLRDDFAGLLRQFRQRLSPQTAGITVPLTSRRHTAGLRREELAERAGISTEYLKRLEQKKRHPSRGVVVALGRALHLGPDELVQLCSAAGFTPPAVDARLIPQEITPAARRLLDRLTDVPVAVCDAAWTVLAGNVTWNDFGCAAGALTARNRNMAWRIFTDAPTDVARRAEDSAAFRVRLVVDLHEARRRYDDPYLDSLVTDLAAASADFRRLWRQTPTGTPTRVDRLTAAHPSGRVVHLERDTLNLDGDLRVVIFTAARPATPVDVA